MEGIAARALKPSFCREISMPKSAPQAPFDDSWCGNGGNGEEFSVDDLLDLSDETFEDIFNGEDDDDGLKDSVSEASRGHLAGGNCNSTAGDAETFPAVPVEDWKELEWVSRFVDDSTPEFSLLCPTGNAKETAGAGPVNRSDRAVDLPSFPAKIPAKARSKRRRTASNSWSFGSPSSASDSSVTTSFSSSSSATSSIIQTTDFLPSLGRPPPAPARKQRRKRAPPLAAVGGGLQGQRRCSHCQVQKTPQWRTGPLGDKTLCNACGVRFKSGRLCPEYRPACSPSFLADVHSNSHRKVLEIRRKKETADVDIDSGLAQTILSC